MTAALPVPLHQSDYRTVTRHRGRPSRDSHTHSRFHYLEGYGNLALRSLNIPCISLCITRVRSRYTCQIN